MTTNVTNLQNAVTTQGTQLTAVQGQISSKIWQQDITTAVNNLQIGGTNLITHSAKLADYIIASIGGYSGHRTDYASANHPSGNYTAITCTQAGTGFYITGQPYNTNGKIKQGDKLTLSGYIYCNKDKGTFNPSIEFGENFCGLHVLSYIKLGNISQ